MNAKNNNLTLEEMRILLKIFEDAKPPKRYYCGIPEIEYIWHGEWSDPELIYKGKNVCYVSLESLLYEDFKEEYSDNDAEFADWVNDNQGLAIEYCELLISDF